MPNLTTNTFKIPVVAIPAILGLRGQKIKDICQTTGATVQLSKPEGKELTANICVTGFKQAVDTASSIIRLAVLHAREGDRPTRPTEYSDNKEAETVLDVFTLATETQYRVPGSYKPRSYC